MYEALMIISNNEYQRVTADQVEHHDFKRVFQCPECHVTLTLREGHTRNGYNVPASFVHPRHGSPCKERVEFDFVTRKESTPFDLIKRGQNSKKLERSFIRCLKYFAIGTLSSTKIPPMLSTYTIFRDYSCLRPNDLSIFEHPFTENWIQTNHNLRKKIEYNQGSGVIHNNPELLIAAATRILSSRKLDSYFNQEAKRVKESILSDSQTMNFFVQKKESDWWRKLYERVYSKNIDVLSPEDLLNEHIDHLNGLLRYIRRGISPDGQKKVFELLIFGSFDLPVSIDIVCTQEQKSDYESRIKTHAFYREADKLLHEAGLEKLNKSSFVGSSSDYPKDIRREAWLKACSDYENTFLEHKSSVEIKREKSIEFLSVFSEELLNCLLGQKNLNHAISEFYSEEVSPNSRFIEFLASAQIYLMKKYDWSVLPLFYEDIYF
ncbi:hypothetical protein SPB21_12330 [Leptothoe sp. ISB3NOV94-8A]